MFDINRERIITMWFFSHGKDRNDIGKKKLQLAINRHIHCYYSEN